MGKRIGETPGLRTLLAYISKEAGLYTRHLRRLDNTSVYPYPKPGHTSAAEAILQELWNH